MASENPTWRQAQIAAELQLKIGIRLSPRTVAKYMPKWRGRPGSGVGSQNWRTFLQNHAKQIVACDFFTVVTASLKVFYVLIVMEHASRRIIHFEPAYHPFQCYGSPDGQLDDTAVPGSTSKVTK
jgi:hypothetical protein